MRARFLPLLLLLMLAAACGSSSSPSIQPVGPARTYHLSGFAPVTAARPGRPTLITFTIDRPSGTALTAYKTGSGPHTGVDLIIVRSDDSRLLYEDTDIGAGGKITQPVVFPTPGRYRIIVDAYPAHLSPGAPINFQLFRWITVPGAAKSHPLPIFTPTVNVHGYRFTLPRRLSIHAVQATLMKVKVHEPNGRPAHFSIWRGALAHAIFIRTGSLDYFHTHVCSPGATNCTSRFGGAAVTGTSNTPGRLTVGVLAPVPGTWRLFLLTYIDGHQLTAPFTLRVS